MAGSSSNWFRPTKGPLAGQAIYIDKATRTMFGVDTLTKAEMNRNLGLSSGVAQSIAADMIRASTRRPIGTARTGGVRTTAAQSSRVDPVILSRLKQVDKPSKKVHRNYVTDKQGKKHGVNATAHGNEFMVYKMPKKADGYNSGWAVGLSGQQDKVLVTGLSSKQDAIKFSTYVQASGWLEQNSDPPAVFGDSRRLYAGSRMSKSLTDQALNYVQYY